MTSPVSDVSFKLDNSFARELPGCYVAWSPAPVAAPRLLYFNRELAGELGLGLDAAGTDELAALFSGQALPEHVAPIAQVYAGHQFGNFSPQLGDGRALLIGEAIDRQGRRRDLAFKGSGRTPFSRNGDGKAAVGPMLREVLIGEAMHALGIPTTRALAVVATGEPVYREQTLPGAILTRVAASHIRVGTFEYFAARDDRERLKQLADYSIARHDAELGDGPQRHAQWLHAVAQRQSALLARWMNVGFIHGVMNTDNMSIAGESIDFGPCAFMEAYHPGTVFSSIDQHGRYAYANQPGIAQWNLARFAEAILPLLADDEDSAVDIATGILAGFGASYRHHWLQGLRAKLGLAGEPAQSGADDQRDTALAEDWLALLQAGGVDYTLAWRRLADAAEGRPQPLHALFADGPALQAWLARWQQRCAIEPSHATAQRAQAMRAVNPLIIPRNHRVEEALDAASARGELGPFEALLDALRRPFDDDPQLARYAEPAPTEYTAGYRSFCGT
ncbi:MAG: YdiU family protein [Rhodocyclales bacterium]|nr:YdiU family protein [Rhodocyclales bacterium]